MNINVYSIRVSTTIKHKRLIAVLKFLPYLHFLSVFNEAQRDLNCDDAMGISGWVTVIHLTEGKTLTGCFSEVEAEQPFAYLHSL